MVSMDPDHITRIAKELDLPAPGIRATADLLADGATVPFIARYRKEATGSLDEVAVTQIRDRLAQLNELDARRTAILKSLTERELLTDELVGKLRGAGTLTVLEDLYLPYRPKRRTRALIARERGLEPLAKMLLAQACDPESEAAAFIDPDAGVADAADALAGARDIIAEWISEESAARADLRALYAAEAIIHSQVIKDQESAGQKFKDYYKWSEPARACPSHRMLAMRRGEKEGYLGLHMAPGEEKALTRLERRFLTGHGRAAAEVASAIRDGYRRLLGPAMETELRTALKQKADVEAIRVFAENLRELLLSSPLGAKRVLAIDPGFRTGCKLVCLDRQGLLQFSDTIFPHTGGARAAAAGPLLKDLCARFEIEAIAIGNGTAGRETEAFVRALGLPASLPIVQVNEAGASIYSASAVAREEFPDEDLTVRGAISIGRRLLDPLAELIKIDPKSIGVGQYQHDVDQKALRQSLDDVVISCVNGVGVDVNTASKQLLTYVSGLGPQLATNIVVYRDEHGPFAARTALKRVPRLGPKAFQQAAGFLRIRGGEQPLDASAVHPESYVVVTTMARDVGCRVAHLMRDREKRERIDIARYVTGEIGIPTLRDILAELAKPGRDPRARFEAFQFAEGIATPEDLRPGMQLPGVVTNVTAFGAFVDIGVHQDGLVHISQMAERYVRDPSEVVKVQQRVIVTVLAVDLERKRISLTLRGECN